MKSQGLRDRRVYLVSQDGQDPQDNQDHLVIPELKVIQALQEWDHQEYLDLRYRTQQMSCIQGVSFIQNGSSHHFLLSTG